MNKKDLIEGYKKEEQMLISKMLDKVEETKQKNKITNTDFLDEYQMKICHDVLNKIKYENYIPFGGYEGAERKILIFYPEKLKFIVNNCVDDNHILIKNDKTFLDKLCAIRIRVPNELHGKYIHKNYLGMVMKLGVVREKVGDILVQDIGADIIILPEIAKYLINSLGQLTRLKKADIKEIEINQVEKVESKTKEYQIVVAALRLDNVIAELARTSRVQAKEIILQERVFINFKNETKLTKQINEKDIITIRGRGRFRILEIIGNTQKGRYIIKVEKYV